MERPPTSECSSECSYDSEEDRVQERLRSMAERRQVEAQAAFESDVLRAWRARRRKADRRGPRVFATHAGADAIEDAAVNVKVGASLDRSIADHRLQWREFEDVQRALRGQSTSHQLVYDDVPWIPDGVSGRDYLEHVARAEHGGSLRKAFAAACLTWHPDKFQNRYKGFFKDDAEWKRVVARVNETFAALKDGGGGGD